MYYGHLNWPILTEPAAVVYLRIAAQNAFPRIAVTFLDSSLDNILQSAAHNGLILNENNSWTNIFPNGVKIGAKGVEIWLIENGQISSFQHAFNYAEAGVCGTYFKSNNRTGKLIAKEWL